MRNFPKQFDQKQTDAMLTMAAQKLGKTPGQLKEQLDRRDIGALTASLSEEQKKQVSSVLSDPRALQGFLQDPQVRELLSRLQKGR